MSREDWEMWSYVVTVIGLPFAIGVFIWEQRKERANEDEEVYQRLSDEYAEFLKLVLQNPDLHLTAARVHELTEGQQERKLVLLDILVSLFERAYLLVYEEDMASQQQRLWKSWEDYMREWCRREDFRVLLPQLLRGEDPDFAAYIRRLAAEQTSGPVHPAPSPPPDSAGG
jgi:hypothetical protein